MDKWHFDQQIEGVREMKRHMNGKAVRGARTSELAEPDIRSILEAAKISQSQFARLIGVSVRTLQNWERHRTQPTGLQRCKSLIYRLRGPRSNGAPLGVEYLPDGQKKIRVLPIGGEVFKLV